MKSLKIGDKVIYPNQGLGVVEGIREEAYDGQQFQVFHLRIISNNTLVTVPSATALEIASAGRSPRGASGRSTSSWAAATSTSRRMEGALQGAPQPHEVGHALRHGHGPQEPLLPELQKPLSFREKKMMEKAKELIVSEISVAAASPSSKVEEKLLGTLSRCFKTAKSRAAA